MTISDASQTLLDKALASRDAARTLSTADDAAIAAREAAIAAELKAKAALSDGLQAALDDSHAFIAAIQAELEVKPAPTTPTAPNP